MDEPEQLDETAGALQGKCPKLIKKWPAKNKVDLEKLKGQWKMLYDDANKMADLECMSTKIVSYNDKNATQMHVLNAQLLLDKDLSDEENRYQEGKPMSVFYDDETVFTFNHPKHGNLAAIESTEDLKMSIAEMQAENMKKYGLEELTAEKMSNMTQEEIDVHNKRRTQMLNLNSQMSEQISKMDPYQRGISVLDVDYDDYLILYSCTDRTDSFNKDGMSK